MYAVIKSGGKQHKVTEGEIITIEKIDAEEGSNVEFSEVLAVNKEGNLQVGRPLLEGAKVIGKVINHLKAPKITIIKITARIILIRISKFSMKTIYSNSLLYQ